MAPSSPVLSSATLLPVHLQSQCCPGAPLYSTESTQSPEGLPRPPQVGKNIPAQHGHCQWTHSLFPFSPQLTQVVLPLLRAPVHQQHHGKGFTRLLLPHPQPSGGFLWQQLSRGCFLPTGPRHVCPKASPRIYLHWILLLVFRQVCSTEAFNLV